jgi:hypothetical protein
LKEIPLDIYDLRVPKEVYFSTLATTIKEHCTTMGMKIPRSFRAFVKKHDREMAGYDWERRLALAASGMSTELLTRWINTMPGGLCRAEMRAILKRRAH